MVPGNLITAFHTLPEQFFNSNFTTTDGWLFYTQRVRLNGVDSIAGFRTPNDPTKPAKSPGDSVSITSGNSSTYTYALESGDLPSNSTPGTKAITLTCAANVATGFGIIHGPYMVSKESVSLKAGDIVRHYWKAMGGSDAYDVFSYLLNVNTGAAIIMANDTGTTTNGTSGWVECNTTVPSDQSGVYKFVFVSGSYDLTGGRALGATLKVTMIEVL